MDNNPEASSAHSDPRHHPENHHHHHHPTMSGQEEGGEAFSPHPQEQQPGYPYHVHADAAHDPAPEEEAAPSSPSKRSQIHMEEEESAHHPGTIQQAQATTATASSTISSNPTKKQRTQRQQQRTPWEERLAQLQAYKDEHGHLEIPIRYKPNPSLGKFVHNTREQYKLYLRLQQQPQDAVAGAPSKPKKCPLTSERVAQLEALGFVFSAGRTEQQEQGWQSGLQQLKEYKEEHGDCFVREYGV